MANQWYQEKTRNVILSHRVRKHVLSTHSKFQQIDIVDTHEYGRMLFLDNMTQSAEVDEFIYQQDLEREVTLFSAQSLAHKTGHTLPRQPPLVNLGRTAGF